MPYPFFEIFGTINFGQFQIEILKQRRHPEFPDPVGYPLLEEDNEPFHIRLNLISSEIMGGDEQIQKCYKCSLGNFLTYLAQIQEYGSGGAVISSIGGNLTVSFDSIQQGSVMVVVHFKSNSCPLNAYRVSFIVPRNEFIMVSLDDVIQRFHRDITA